MNLYSEPYRPQFHFSPKTGWMNDPNGLVYYDGEYHLFYQFTPGSIEAPGPKHWGHTVSTDLIHWEHLPVALSPDSSGEIYSGSVVVDWQNTSGFRTGDTDLFVAIFTHHKAGVQEQSLAYSNDRGRTWTKFADNPVIPNTGSKDFRDPKMFWHSETDQWVLVLASGDHVKFYTSPDLIGWRFSSQFGELNGAHGGVWECPDLFPLPIEGCPGEKNWVLLVSIGAGGHNGGSVTQYFIGDFDGETFSNYHEAARVNWVDHGMDNYAGVTFSGIQDRQIFIGWMSNWLYAFNTPTKPWRGAMTTPRELKLIRDKEGIPLLFSAPIRELQSLRTGHTNIKDKTITARENQPILIEFEDNGLEIAMEIKPGYSSQSGIILKTIENDDIRIGYDNVAKKLFVDRRNSGSEELDARFGGHIHSAPIELTSGSLHLHIFIDRSSLEVFANHGSVVITDLIFPRSKINGVELYALNGDAYILNLDAWILSSIW